MILWKDIPNLYDVEQFVIKYKINKNEFHDFLIDILSVFKSKLNDNIKYEVNKSYDEGYDKGYKEGQYNPYYNDEE